MCYCIPLPFQRLHAFLAVDFELICCHFLGSFQLLVVGSKETEHKRQSDKGKRVCTRVCVCV